MTNESKVDMADCKLGDLSTELTAAQRRAQAFSHLDDAKLGWFHLRAVLVSGVGFFTDAYDIFVISLALPMNLCRVVSKSSSVRGIDVLAMLAIWRFFLGIGIGGDYPMSAIITSEFANVKHRGMMMAAVFAMQGIGILIGGIVTVITLAAFETLLRKDILMLDYVWRIMFGFGVIPAIVAIYFRMTIPETPRYTVDVVGDEEKAQRDMVRVLEMNEVADVSSSWVPTEKPAGESAAIATTEKAVESDGSNFIAYFGQWKHAKVLFGTAYCWFALDIAWYGLSLNQATILTAINYSGAGVSHQYERFYQTAVGAVLISLMGTVPGYWVTVATIERLGRKPIQYLGFAVITVCLLILAIFWDFMLKNTTYFIVVYTIAQFFFNFGPNSTTFVVPGEVFPTRWRSTGHGLSAAAGKLGAIIGVQVVGPFFTEHSQAVLITFAVVMATGFAATYFIPETKGKTLEELSE
ncbi:hypothetical protein BASA81_017336 [Batrachochytrium salamandrivorans]|nr:hypothetical protein BASA81_017336 [Batrachochytrium salamandrivorans]